MAASGLNYPDGIEARENLEKVYVTLYIQPYALASFDIQPNHTLANKQVLPPWASRTAWCSTTRVTSM